MRTTIRWTEKDGHSYSVVLNTTDPVAEMNANALYSALGRSTVTKRVWMEVTYTKPRVTWAKPRRKK